MTPSDPRPRARGVRRRRERAARRCRGRAALRTLAVTLLALAGLVAAQPRAEFVLGVAGEPVAGAWNPVSAVVRDAPGARLLVEIDAGGLDRGEIVQRAEWTFPDASGVQRLDVDLPLPAWRSLTWRIEHGARTLASGSLPVRERDARPLTLIVTADLARWAGALPEGARVVPAAAGELPTRVAAWDGVAAAIFDGSAAAPSGDAVVAAASAGVHVLLPTTGDAGHAALAALLEPGGLRLGAGGIEPLPADAAGVRAALEAGGGVALASDHRRALRDVAAEALPATRWTHLGRGLVTVVVAAYALAVWVVLRVGGPAGSVSGAMLIAVAWALAPRAAPVDVDPVREGAVVVAAGGLGTRSELREVARLPRGDVELPGVLAPLVPMPVLWLDGATRLPLEPGGRARLSGPPRAVGVPDGVREAGPDASSDGVPESLLEALPADVRAIADGSTWWLVRSEPPSAAGADGAVARAPGAGTR